VFDDDRKFRFEVFPGNVFEDDRFPIDTMFGHTYFIGDQKKRVE
jgi:hypothetical protein